ncbi:PREDICTED: nucleolar protein 6 [Gekko japonicus]|uniref:Nucleolar protein 6 n=1 Tax=Gekko japonicus TaxID=146911 RepID=A0ABM1LCI5_GEKJA|nr:PREDICTED: nucleolar protein 6 [Gekko japonicus]
MLEDAERDANRGDQEAGEANNSPAKESRPRGKRRALASEGLLQPVKVSKATLYKPPTSEELSQLKETENLFHSNLLRLQIEELLKEVTLKEKRRQKIDAFLHQINALLAKIPATTETDMTDQSWLPKGVKVPLVQVPFSVKGRFHFLPPVSVKVVGSYLLGTCIKPEVNVDVALTMPRAIFQDKDNLNQRYHRKRALYLAHVAHHLAKEPLFGSVMFAYANGNHLKPVVLLQPQGKDAKTVTVRLYACPPQGLFKPCRLYPGKNNVRTAWFTEKGAPTAGEAEPPTPHYNNSILWDLAMEAHLQFLSGSASDFPGMRDGVALLKVWLRQRELEKGFGCFNGFLASMLVAYLLSRHQINKVMSGYQVLRNVLQFLASTDLTTSGISLSKDGDGSLPTLTDFHRAFQVVFVDSSGLVNLCADMSASKYKQIQFEAKHSMEVLDDRTVDGFQLLLITRKSLIHAFDHWPINAEPPKHKDTGSLSFGLLLSPDFAASVLEKGPEADSPEAVEFRKFWGERSELRRFQDGSICEAVLWDATTQSQKRLIPEQIIRHLLQLHTDIPGSAICYTGALLESLIRLGREPAGTGEEAMVDVVRSYDDLSRKLWNLEGLPLTVTAVQGAHPALRYTDVFPPVPVIPDYAYYARNKDRESLVPLAEKPCPVYISPMKVLCHMEGSGQWPQDQEAIRRIKAAFQIQLAELLRRQYHLLCRPGPAYTDVYKDGYVFRLRVAYHREPQILKEVVTPEGMLKYQDTEESLRLELETLHLPFLTSTLHGLQQQHPAFGSTCRLAKRWVSAQMLNDSLSEECVDLLVASLFLCPAPYMAPSSPQVGFLHFLRLLATFDWKNSPLIVNLNAELKVFEENSERSSWVFQNAWWRASAISAQHHKMNMVFRPPLDLYDVLIHLNPKQIPRHLQAVDRPVKSFSRGMLASDAAVKTLAFPVVDYDPVQLYLRELQASIMRGRMMAPNTESLTVPNVAAILEDFEILGEGLVRAVETRSEKWSI